LPQVCSTLGDTFENEKRRKLVPVSAIVFRAKISGTKYHVPSWALHWGIVVDQMLYHLRYDQAEKRVEFHYEKWMRENGSKYDIRVVGNTCYSHEAIRDIGRSQDQEQFI